MVPATVGTVNQRSGVRKPEARAGGVNQISGSAAAPGA